MMIEQKGNTVDEAVETALKKLGLPREKVKIEVITEGKKGVFGLGAHQAIVRVTALEEKEVRVSVSPPEMEEQERGAKQKAVFDEGAPVMEFLQRVFKDLGIEVKFRVSATEEESRVINIITSESALLIGKQGRNLEALQYLTNVAINKGAERRVKAILDVEGYRERQKNSLITLAKKVADEVRQTGKKVSLEPMSAYERRIIHVALQEDPDITTESAGERGERRVVIKMRKT